MRRKRIMLAVVCIAILAGPVAAETPYLEPFVLRETLSDKVLSVPLLSYICLKHDWDGDGTPDLNIGDHDGGIWMFRRKPLDTVRLESGFRITAESSCSPMQILPKRTYRSGRRQKRQSRRVLFVLWQCKSEYNTIKGRRLWGKWTWSGEHSLATLF